MREELVGGRYCEVPMLSEQQVPEEGPILPIANDPPPQETVPNQAWQETSYSNSIFASGFSITIVSMFIIFRHCSGEYSIEKHLSM